MHNTVNDCTMKLAHVIPAKPKLGIPKRPKIKQYIAMIVSGKLINAIYMLNFGLLVPAKNCERTEANNKGAILNPA